MIARLDRTQMADGTPVRTLAVAGQIRPGNRTVVAALPVNAIRPHPLQPRRHFAPEALAELADSIRVRGLLQPIVVKHDGDGYLIMAGERRWRAAQMAGLQTVPALVRDDDPLEVAMIENLQREDLTPLEEAEGLGQLIEQFGYTHEALASMLGKSRPYVSNTLALRRLPEDIKEEYSACPDVSREVLIQIAREPVPERQAMLWRLTRLRKLSVEKFRAEASGGSTTPQGLREVARIVRRLGRRVRALDPEHLAAAEREQLERLLQRARARLDRLLKTLSGAG